MNKKRKRVAFLISLVTALACAANFSNLALAAEKEGNAKSARKEFNKHIEEGKRHYGKKMYEEAVKEYEKALAIIPENKTPPSLIEKTKKKQVYEILKDAKSHYKKKLYEEAIEECREALTIDSKNKTATKLIDNAEKKLAKKSGITLKSETEAKKTPPDKNRVLTMDDCIEIAVENSNSLKIAKKQLKVAEFKILESLRKFGPSVNARFEESTGKVDNKWYGGAKMVVEGRQPVFYGGEIIFSAKQAKVNLEIVRKDYERVRNDLILQVKRAYYSLDKAKKTVRIQKNLREKTKEYSDRAKAGYEAHVIAQIEYLKLESQYNQSRFQLVSAEEDLALANLILQQAMNITDDIKIVEVGEPNIVGIELDECLGLAYLNRPEVIISVLTLEFIDYQRKITRAKTDWPKVDFVGSYGNAREDFVQNDLPEGIAPRNLGPEYYVGTKVSLPLWGSTVNYAFSKETWQPVVSTVHGTEATTHSVTASLLDGLGDVTRAKETELEFMRSEEELNKAKQDTILEVKEKFFDYRKAIVLMEVAKSKVEFQKKQVEVLNIRHSLGDTLASEVVEEMIRLAEEKYSYVQAICDYFTAIAELNKAIGINNYFKV